MDITPVPIWYNGATVNATQLLNTLVYDNLTDEAKFYWQLLDASNNKLEEGNTIMSGTDYVNWNTTTDINLAAYQFVAAELNLTLL